MMEKDLSFLYSLTELPDTQFVIDETVYRLYQQYFSAIPDERLFLVKAVEENKVIRTVLSICEKMTTLHAKRNAHLISVGGGIIQDLTGFAANILYRGIRWTFLPTTLLSACDSCIGGKTSLNYKKYKNLLGTLTERDFESGLGEVIKFNIMAGESGIGELEQKLPLLLDRDEDTVKQFVEKSLRFKKGFIETDEFDVGERRKLNFAHTFGHAIETVTGYQIPR